MAVTGAAQDGLMSDHEHGGDAEMLRLFRQISDKAIHGDSITDLQGRLIYINPYFARVHGYEPEEVTGKNISLFHTNEQMPVVGHLLKRLIEKGQTGPDEVWHVHRNGRVFPMLMSNIVITGSDGKSRYMATSAIDISDLKQTQSELKVSEEKYRLLSEKLEQLVSERTAEVQDQKQTGQHRLGAGAWPRYCK